MKKENYYYYYYYYSIIIIIMGMLLNLYCIINVYIMLDLRLPAQRSKEGCRKSCTVKKTGRRD